MPERPRFFSREQVAQHEQDFGKGCQWLLDKGVRCGQKMGYTESGHLKAFIDGGTTHPENLLRTCRPHHALQHWLDEQPWASQLIISRMPDNEFNFLQKLAKSVGWTPKRQHE